MKADAVHSAPLALSVVVAVREAEETIGRDVRRIADHLRATGRPFEILAINDGCCDNSLAVLRLLASQVPELRLCAGDAAGRAFIRGAAEAQGATIALLDSSGGSLPLGPLGWALSRLERGADAIVFRGRCIMGRRLVCLAAIARAWGRGDLFERSFERNARGLSVEVVGTRPRRPGGLLAPVLRFLAA
jgi:glycosyltransferase involved in cell wall biosynthesis